MGLKAKYDSKADIPEAVASLYSEKDGAWVLDVEGMVGADELATVRSRLDEFRTNNLGLQEKLKGFEGKKFLTQEEIDEYDRLAQQEQDLKDKKLMDAGKLDELLASRTEKMRNDFEAQIKSLREAIEKANTLASKHEQRLSHVLVESEVGQILSKSGLNPVAGALEDIYSRARNVWKVNEAGVLAPVNAKGDTIYGGGGDALTLDEWAAQVVKDAPYLFAANQGTGGEGSNDTGRKGSDGLIRIPRTDEAMKSKHVKELAEGKAVIVD